MSIFRTIRTVGDVVSRVASTKAIASNILEAMDCGANASHGILSKLGATCTKLDHAHAYYTVHQWNNTIVAATRGLNNNMFFYCQPEYIKLLRCAIENAEVDLGGEDGHATS